MDYHSCREVFHRELRSFIKDLIKVFPDDRDIKMVSSSLNIAIMDDPEDSIILKFYDSLHPCENYIHTQNEDLFYNKIIKSDIELFSKIGFYWDKLDSFNKEVVWKYVTLLYKLSKQFYTIRLN